MTPACRQAVEELRDLSMFKWYVIPPIVDTFYIYVREEEWAP